MDKLAKGNEYKDNELYSMTQENMSLRERIEVLENIIRSNKRDYDSLVSANLINSIEKSTYEFHGGTKGKKSTID